MSAIVNVPEISPEGAKRRMEHSHDYCYLDVRTVPEFLSGHPPHAMNVPIAFLNPSTGEMDFNSNFLRVVKATLSTETRVILGCKTGERSAVATRHLLAAGYRHAVNMTGGFSGVTDSTGQVIEEGWSTHGFPVERGQGGCNSYDALRARADVEKKPNEEA